MIKQRPVPSSPNKVIKMLKGQKKHTDKEQGKSKYEAPCSVNYRATQDKKTGVKVYLVPPTSILSPGILYPGVKCPPLKFISYLFFFYNFNSATYSIALKIIFLCKIYYEWTK